MRSRCGWGSVALALLMLGWTAVGQNGSAAYNPANETKMKGTIEELKMPAKGDKDVAHLKLKSVDGVIDISLAPRAFLEDMGSTLAKGDEVSITGCKVKQEGGDFVLAREVVKGGETLVLRDDKGKPVWNWHK
jgi:hypothetical protein